ncbi:TPA: hypothetical protein ACP633_001242 [Escherichia coli]|uniref:DUF3102 domain-containing protein n=1 Tax=Citrobacter freundii TaxID=546 RepID=A0AB33GWM0_CITFR|nr:MULTISPECIES: hypothetical protein [Enterobacteriaceae]HBC5626949.1 hypothetical protein [Escherichia coli]AXZ46970.1 hypothetical protein AM363_08390 [Citrobacter freundii]AXZ47557.1 hypothetical protein AM363_11665 [Citrobacter freundii]QLU49923.1 hypothetical protein HV269_05490 [Citrobacter sp. RHBSTW-00696]TYF78699.1 hypothetical protein DJ539_01990 [Enterobacter hormaechei]
MARTKSKPVELTPDVILNPELEATQNFMANISNQITDDRDLVNQLLGQAQMAETFGKFSQTVWSSKLAFVKHNKLYQSLKGKKTPNGLELKGTWSEFCGLLGVSDEKANQDIANLSVFGEEALESMSRMGIGYRELRQFRRLPDDQKTALIEVAKEGDKAAFIELAEELISKHEKEKADLQTDLEINRQSLAEQKAKVHRLIDEKTEIEDKFRVRVQRETPEEKTAHVKQEIAGLQAGAFSALMSISNGFIELSNDTEATGAVHAGYMAGILDDIQAKIMAIRDDLNLPAYREYDPRPDWLDADEVVIKPEVAQTTNH